MFSIPFFNNNSAWKEGKFSIPWQANRISIYSVLSSNYDNTKARLLDVMLELPDEEALIKENEIRFVAGGLEGAFGHHSKPEDVDKNASKAYSAIKRLLQNPNSKNIDLFYRTVNSESALEYIDPLLDKIISDRSINHNHLRIFAEWLTKSSPDRGPVKIGLAILGLYSADELKELFFLMGSHEEFTLYATVAIQNFTDDNENGIWRIAKSVAGWGRIHAVERLKDTENKKIKEWMVREGYQNSIMYEYLAYLCATSGGLLSELQNPKPDDALIIGAGEILRALVNGGPAEDMSDYLYGIEASTLYLQHLQNQDSNLETYDVVSSLQNYFNESNASQNDKAKITSLADEYLSRAGWIERCLLYTSPSPRDRG